MDSASASHVETSLQSIWTHVLNLPHVALDQPFLSLGGDSISAMQVVGQCRKEGMSVTVQDVLRSRSITQLANAVKDIETSSYTHEEYFDEEFDLTPIQYLYFQRPNINGHFNQSFYLAVTRRTSANKFQAAVEQLVARHSMLRARFSFSDEQGWQQRLTNDVSESYRFQHITVSSQTEIDASIGDSQRCLDPVNGPLFAADFFDHGDDQYAFLTGHHLVVDLVTWRLLLEELEEILTSKPLLAPALSFQKWAELQSDHAESIELDEVLPPVDVPPLDFLYWGIEHQDNTYGNAGHAGFEIDKDLSSAFLTSCHDAYRTEPVEVLLASLIHAWSNVFKDRPVPAIFNEGHGREPWTSAIDITRTVGWFTALSPIHVVPAQNPTDTVRLVKDYKRRIPGNGRPYFARRCLTEEGRRELRTHWPMEILFNYLGQYQQLERPGALLKPLGTMAGETGKAGGTSDFGHDTCRWGLFEISAFVFKGHLKVAFTFNRNMQHQALIDEWISECQITLTQVINRLVEMEHRPTLSDFPLLSITEKIFSATLKRLSTMGIRECDIEDVYPCSNMQEGLLLSQTKDAGFYAAATLHEIISPSHDLSWEDVAEAWKQVVRRHSLLRTVFFENAGDKEGLYNQVVLKNIDPNFVHIRSEDESSAVKAIQDQRSVRYDSGLCPNHRFTVCTTMNNRIFCSLDISHVIMDGHSMSLMITELGQACSGKLRGMAAPYSDYISWYKKQSQEESLDFWKSYLGGSEVCSFPTLIDEDVSEQEKQLVTIRMDLDSVGLPDLQGFCNAHGITLSNIFHTAWALTVSSYIGSNDVTFGYLTSTRDSEQVRAIDEMVGPIINTLVCRVNMSDRSRCLLDTLQDVQRDYMESIPHRHVALADVQHALHLSGASLFNTALSYRRLPQENSEDTEGIYLKQTRPIYDPTEYPVSINIEVGEDSAAVDLDYWSDHLSALQATNIADTFVHSLENIIRNSKRRLSALNHVSPKHLQQIQTWNVMPATIDECVHERFACWVACQPDAPAICGQDGDYTYAELDAATTRLAVHLMKLGVGPEKFVPTCFDKSSLAVVAMLAVLKAGGAAVPLDATHPRSALQTRLEDAGSRIVLTTAERADKFEGLVSDLVIVDPPFLESLPLAEGSVHVDVRPHNPCFVIFTSGSTGRPKGVVLEHSAMVTSAEAHGSKIGLGQGSRMLQFASYTFDNSLEEMFTTLQRGGCVCVPSEVDRVNDLAGVIARLKVNMMDLTPTVAALLTPGEVPTIERLCLGAEPLTKALVDTWRPHVKLMGQYGPSEASINSAFKDFTHGGEATNIGKSVGCVGWIVEPENRNRLVPIGCKGELLLEGPILSRGYLNDIEKTQAAFIVDPDWACVVGATGRRFYCTGDLVQYTSEGEMMYLGRKDNQVKLHGQRIELGEIEHHMRLILPSSSKSAVELVKFKDSGRSNALVAFLCLQVEPLDSRESAPAAISEMTKSARAIAKQVELTLANVLPTYYVPSMFMPVTSMPMTTSGKLDRKVLRTLAAAVTEAQLTPYRLAGKSGRAPSSQSETLLAGLWASVLKLNADAIGVEDAFFRLGGDSISAMRLVSAARREGISLNVASVFAYPKLLDMAATVVLLSSDELNTAPEPDMVPFELISHDAKEGIIAHAAAECDVKTNLIEDIFPCSKLQEGLIMLSSKDPGTYVVQPIYRLPSDIDIPRFKEAWEEVVASEGVLRTRIIYTEEHGFLQVVLHENVEWHYLPDLKDITDASRRLPAKNGAPLTTFTIVGEATDTVYFVWTAHHAVYDGWSWAALFRKIETYYHATQDLPKSVPYSRFIKYLSTLDQKKSDDFWLSKLDNMTAPQFPQLPSPDHRVEANGQLLHHIKITRNSMIEVTMPSMIRAAWGLLLATYSGHDDVLWGETNSGREAAVSDIETIIGPTITTAPVRMRLSRQATVNEFLTETQKQTSISLPYQFAGLQHIRKLSSETAVACDFQSFLGIEAGDDLADVNSQLWNMESANTIGTDFFSYSLIFNCKVSSGTVHVEALFDNRVIESWLVERMVDQFEYTLNHFNDPDSQDLALQEIDLLNRSDQEIIRAWNSNAVQNVPRCIHDVIAEDQVSTRPNAAAIDAWDTGVLSYQDLDEQSTVLARHLVALGVKSEQFVPLCFDKSGWAIVAIIAVLKAGAAFIPLDFEAPLPRLRDMVVNASANLILCGPSFEAMCHSITGNTLVVNQETIRSFHTQHHNLPRVYSDCRAYAFYTSGSTGKPKGTVMNHCHWVTSSIAFSAGFGICEGSRVLQFASYTFDASLIEILSTLMCGGTICVPDQASRTNDLVGVMRKFNVNVALLTPSVVRMIQPAEVPQLKTLTLVGEAMSQQDLLIWADRLALGNGYGPTECAAVATIHSMTSSTKSNNLGKPVTARGWVVNKDNHDALLPVGAVGELLLEGGGVGSGYLNDPEKTAQAFIADVKWASWLSECESSRQVRIYKTGDLVRYNEDGTMLYLGRKDSQAKVRGQRLELSEVEHHLMYNGMAQNACASVPTTGPCAKRLVGIVSLRNVTLPDTTEPEIQLLPQELASLQLATIRDRLCESLPSYMIPSLWIAIQKLPLMASGKLDRKRLVQWLEKMDKDTYRSVSTVSIEAPQSDASDIERKVQAIFANVLNLPVEDVRLNQSFLHLGGDSIAAMQVSSQSRAQGLPISVQDVIRANSITSLASSVDISREREVIAQEPTEYNLPFDLSPIQQLFLDTVGDSHNHFNQTEILRLSRNFDIKEIKAALVALVQLHPMLRGRFVKDAGSKAWRQHVTKNTETSFRLRQNRVQSANDAALRPIVDDSQMTLDITRGPTFAIELFEINDTSSQAIALVAHHLIIDVVSWGIVLGDLQSLLSGVQPPSQSLPYHTWLQQQSLQAKQDSSTRVFPLDDTSTADYDYWEMADQRNVSGDAIEEDVQLSARDTMLLLGAQDALETEILDILVAALLESFRMVFPDRSTITIHNEGHGRETFTPKQDLSRTIGWFSTMTPIHLPTSPGEPTDIVSTIRWVKGARDRIPDKGRPYFAYRNLTKQGCTSFKNHWPAEAVFNYVGRTQHGDRKDGLFQGIEGIDSSEIGADVPRLSLFDITAAIDQGAIKLSFGWNKLMKHQSEIRTWVAQCRQTLVDAVDELLQTKSESSMSSFKHLPLIYNAPSKLRAALPSDLAVQDIEDIYPTSPMQQGILLTQSRNPDLYTYHTIFEVQTTDSTKSIDPRRIAEAWQVVVHRHPALRTIFINSLAKNGRKDQLVVKDRAGRVQFLKDCDDDTIADSLRAQELINCGDLLPPHRMIICVTRSGRVWVKLELSHAINDGTSIANILGDLARAYARKLTMSDAGPLYSDYIAYILSSSREADLAYWKDYLSGIEPCFFPTLNDGKTSEHESGSIDVHLGDTKDVQEFCKKNGVTLSNVLQLAWALTLHCFVGASDVSFGLIASGRDVPVKNVDEAVGCFVNMLIARLSFSDETTVAKLLESLQTSSMNALSHQSCSLADLQHELQLPALFNTAFTFQRRSVSHDPEETALLYENMEAADAGEYAITVNADVTDRDFSVDFGFWKDKILPEQAQSMADTFEQILRGIITCDPNELTVGKLDLFTPSSLRKIMEWNADLPSPIRRCVHEVIHEQGIMRPRTTKAVEGWDGTFTYQEFDKITDRVAISLQENGVTTETFVPILFEKSSWAIVGMVAIMKAGGAYVPLDPSHPESRLRELISDVGAKVVLCSRSYHSKASEVAETALILDQRSVKKLAVKIGAMPKSDVSPDNASYCLFTSGTTGKPKGTIVPHQSFCTSAAAFTRRMNIHAASRTFQFASYTFDASCIEILSALTVGATVCVPTDNDRMDNPAGAIHRLKVNWSLLTPSVLSTIEPDRVPTLKTLVSGGEALPGPILKKWGTSTCFINAYGPTECAVVAATAYKSTLDHKLIETEPATIGTGSGARLWIVHPRNHDKLMPVGSVGELVIEGPTVARGYLNDEAKTAKAFICNPAWATRLPSESGVLETVRMYKSGDLVRYNTDGSVSYIGRKDTQIKLNGQRIELGEIEFHVGKNLPENVQSAVELVAPSAPSSAKALAVFFAVIQDASGEGTVSSKPAANNEAAADELLLPMNEQLHDLCKAAENGLGGALPSYMIPSIFIPVAKMPWTSAGKLDRNRLRKLAQDLDRGTMALYRLNNMANKKQPRTDAQKKIHKIVCSVLNLPGSSVGINDSFVRLGGDSISAMRLVASAQAEKLELSFIDIFKHPKLDDLALIGALSAKTQKIEKPVKPFELLPESTTTTEMLTQVSQQYHLARKDIQDAYPTSALQEALLTLSIKQSGAYVAQHVLALNRSLDVDKLKIAWQQAVQEMDILRTRIIQLPSGVFIQLVLKQDPIDWQENASLQEAEKGIESLPTQLGDKLTSYALVLPKSGNRYFVWTIHHALYDGWSIGLMLQRVQQLYQEGPSNKTHPLYTRFIDYLRSINLEDSAKFWKAHLAGAAPYQFPQHSHSVQEGPLSGGSLSHNIRVSPSKHVDITQSNLIRATWSLLISAYTSSNDVVFGETLAGRDIAVTDITNVCGPTLTTVPTRVTLDNDMTLAALLRQISTMVTDRIPHQHHGLSELRTISEQAAVACDFQNLLVIQTEGDSLPDSMWSAHDGDQNSNFFTYPLVIECKMGKSTTEVLAHYNQNVITRWQVQRILYQFEAVWAQLNSVSHVRDIRVFSEQDAKLLRNWNSYEPEVIEDTVPSSFFNQVARQPNATAVSAFDGEFTYAELNNLASILAQELVKNGAGPETLIPICLDKSKWAIVAIMAVLISGSGYVPLSPDYPDSRQRLIIEACKATIMVCSPAYQSQFAPLLNHIILVSEANIRQLPACRTPNFSDVKSHSIAYVIFDSGSTGTLKGTIMEHRSIVSSSAAICKGLHITPTSRVLQFCPFDFDVSVGETLTVLMQGATICIPSEEQRTTNLAKAITTLRADWAFLTHSVANTLEGPRVVPTLKTLVTSGVAMTAAVIDKWASGLRLYNSYGPTEGAVFAVANDQVSARLDPSSIGRMLRSGRAWLTHPNNPQVLAPIGAVAELCLEGALLARGYLNEVTRTSEVFIDNPAFFKEFFKADSRIYRTGDLVRYGPDGSLTYLGRKDDQIKLAGQRVETGEIEHHLQADSDVRHAIVDLPKAGPCENKLVVVLSVNVENNDAVQANVSWHTLSLGLDVLQKISKIRDRLSNLVPAYMTPTVWIPVSRIPALASTKFDKEQVRSWLETMDQSTFQKLLELEDRERQTKPVSTAFATLQSICARVFNISTDAIEPNESWLSLGGDSITAMKFLAKCRSEGINLTLNQVLRAKSLAHLAENVKSTTALDNGAEVTEKSFGLSPIQRFYIKTDNVQENSHFNQSSTLRLAKNVDAHMVKQAFDSIVRCHTMLRARFSECENGQWQQSILADIAGAYAFNHHDVPSESSITSIVSATQKSLDFCTGPVFAVDLFNVRGSGQILFIAAHHLVIDVVSWGIVLGDLEDLIASNCTITLQKPLPFQNWCEKQLAHATESTQQEIVRKQTFSVEPASLTYWGMDKRPNLYGDVEQDGFAVDRDISALALNDHGALRTEVVDLLLAAVVHSFSRIFMNRKTPTVFTESHGREAWENSNIDLSRTVGWFTTLYPVTVPIGPEEDEVTHTVRQIKDYRRKVAENGRPYFAHRFLTDDGEKRYKDHRPMEILFNYTGRESQADSEMSLFQPVHLGEEEDAETSDVGAKTTRMALFEISASVSDGQIQVNFMYNRWMKNRKGVRRWIAECQQTLVEIVEDLSSIETPQPTLADFPLLPLESYSRLERVLKTLPPIGIQSFAQVEDIYPCSAIQTGMILSQIKSPESYWSSTTFEVRSKKGAVDAVGVAEAWKKVVQRHPALRTVFVDSVCKGGVFDQVVIKDCDAGLVSRTCSDADVSAILASVKHSDLNGKKKPVLPQQAVVLQTNSGKIIVKITVNHAVIDGGSLAIIGRDLQDAYQKTLPDIEGPLYSDYIKYLQSLSAASAVDYWKQKLKGIRPCYFPTTSQDVRKRELRSLDMRFDRWTDLHAFTETSNVTFANTLLTAWALVLRSYTDSADVCYGYLSSGRNVPIDNIENAVGAFINMLVSRLRIVPNLSLLELIQNVQDDYIESMPHQHCSMAQFQHDLGLSGKSLFNTAVSIQNRFVINDPAEVDSDIEFEQLDGYDPSEFAMTVNVDATRNDEGIRFTYWSDATTDREVKNVASLMGKILHHILDNDQQTVTDVDVTTNDKSSKSSSAHVTPLPLSGSSPFTLRSDLGASDTSPPALRSPKMNFPVPAPVTPTPAEQPDWSNLIRSIVSEMVPQIVEQIVAKNALTLNTTAATIDEMTEQMTSMVHRRASSSLPMRPNVDMDTNSIQKGSISAPSVRSRRMSIASDAESRIQTATDMVASIGLLATEVQNGVAPDFVEKKLLTLWSQLLDVVEESIDQDDGFFNLGGDSIIAMRLVGAAREEGLTITVADVFKNPTFADMARAVRVAEGLIDEVMSRAGGDSVLGKSEAGDPPNPQHSGHSSYLLEGYRSVISDNNDADPKTLAVSATRLDSGSAKQDLVPRKLQGSTSGPQNSRPQTRRRSSVKSPMPQTIPEGIELLPKSVSLLGDPNIESIISKVQVFKGGISDVYPVTDFQALAITGTLLESKSMLNYFYMDGNGLIDLRKLKQAASRMVQAFDILRTVFVPYGDRFLQVVLRKLQPDFIYQQTDDDLEAFTAELRQKDRENGPRLGDPFIQIVVARQKQTSRYRILMRLSHAQYDGVCMSTILGALQDSYNGLPVSSAPSFGNFVKESVKQIAGAHDHWKEILRGSKMTEIVKRFGPNYQRSAGRTVTLEKSLNVKPLSRINITAATVVKAAWAATLARVAGKSDIVFGHIISGRNGGVKNIQSIVGPCLNIVPVRVVYRPEWAVQDLLSYIQEQQVANMPYESLGFRDITRHCTDWPDWTNFSSILQHDQNIQDDKPTIQLGGIEFRLGAVGSQEDFADFSVHTTSRGKSSMDVTLTYAPNTTITPEFALQVFELLCTNVVTFAEDPSAPLPSPSELTSRSSSAVNPDKVQSKSADKAPVTLPIETGLSDHELNSLVTTLRSAWEQILHDEHGIPPPIDLSSDFFQLGGDIMGLAQVASILDQEKGFRVRIEDLIDKSMFVEQVGLLAVEKRTQIDKEERNPWGEKGKKKAVFNEKDKRGSVFGKLAGKMGLRKQ